jgi:CRISPR/Cas system CSM-associated protein Csm2 small subunit
MKEAKEGNVNDILLNRLKEYLQKASKTDVVAAYHSKFITFFGPLLLAFHESVRYGNAKTREACWLSSLLMFCA